MNANRTTLTADSLILDIHNNRVGQWVMLVSNNGVVLGETYGPLPRPSDEVLKNKARRIAGQRG